MSLLISSKIHAMDAKAIFSNEKLNEEISKIRKFCSWNGFPNFLANKIIKVALNERRRNTNEVDGNLVKLYVKLPRLGYKCK